jgi:hypothetical protein
MLVVVLAAPAFADEEHAGRPVDKGTFGIGIIVGEPTGLCGKLYLKDDQAIQAALGVGFIGDGFLLDVDYVFHPWILQDKDTFVLPVFLGPGVRLFEHYASGGGGYFAPGLRAVIGLLFDFKNAPLDAFLQLAGVLEFRTAGGGVHVEPEFGIGLRYYF